MSKYVCNLIVSSTFCVLNSLLLGISIHNQIKDASFMNITCSTQTTHARPYFRLILPYQLLIHHFPWLCEQQYTYFIYTLPLPLVITHYHLSTTHLLMPFSRDLFVHLSHNIVCNSKVKH